MFYAQLIKLIKKYILIILAVIIILYLAFCDAVMSISFTMNLCFITAAMLLIFLQFCINNPIDPEESEPSFFHIFIKVSNVLLFSVLLLITLFNILYPKNYISDDSNKGYDYIIVFGAGIADGKTVVMNSRLDNAIEYADKYHRCKFVLTGARGEREPIEEAVYMRNYMVERGISDSRIIIDPYSINTKENIFNALTLIRKDVFRRNPKERIITRPFKSDENKFDLDFLNIGFMSSEYHLTRINLMARKYGIYKPYDIPCDTRDIYKPYFYIREDLSLVKAFVLNELKF